MLRSMRYRTLGLALVVIAVVAAGVPGETRVIVTKMPGRSFQGELDALSPPQLALKASLEAHVDMLATQIGERNMQHHPALERAASYIEKMLVEAGYEPASQRFDVDGQPVRNIEVELRGAADRDRIVLIGAHYDSAPGTPGANDNGSGVAALLELARALADRRPRRTVRFVAFVNEEPPHSYTSSMGSRRYAERSAERGETVVAMLSLETIGYYSDAPDSQRYPFPVGFFYPDRGNFIGFVGNRRSARLVKRAVERFREHARFPSEGLAAPSWVGGVSWSDHWSFWQIGAPAIMVTDTAFYRYLSYHMPSDRADVIDYARLARVVDGLVGVVEDLANDESEY